MGGYDIKTIFMCKGGGIMKKYAKGIFLCAAAFAMAAGIRISADAAVAAPSISLKEQTGSGQIVTSWTFKYADLQPGQTLYFNVYGNNNPKKSETGRWNKDLNTGREYFYGYYSDTGTTGARDTELTIGNGDLKPGRKTVVAYLFNEGAYDAAWEAYSNGTAAETPQQADYYSPASNAITIDVSMETDVSTTIKKKSITLDMNNRRATGYQIYRKVGKKFKKIATVAKDTYKDTGLTANTQYTYKVRPYYKDPDTGAVVYGEDTTLKRVTKGGSIKLKAEIKKSKNVKLSWKKVKGASGYEIYRSNGSSSATEIAKGQNDYYESYTLLKTLGKKKKKFVDKKTQANEEYTYIVRAILPEDKKADGDSDTIIEEEAYVDLSFGMPRFSRNYNNANGDETVEWRKVYGVDGYIIKKYVEVYNADGTINEDQTDWVEIGRLGKNATRYTFRAELVRKVDGTYDNTTRYRISAYKGNTVSEGNEIETTKSLGLVSNVSAKNIGNGVQVSWTAVPGAAYYEVYRVRAGSLVENKDLGGYANNYGHQVTEYVGAQAPVAVNVAAINAAVGTENAVIDEKLDPAKTYYYRNYQYARDTFTGTSMIDYTYDMYPGNYYTNWDDSGKPVSYEVYGFTEADSDDVRQEGPEDGVAYQYYVIAYAADADPDNPAYEASFIPGTTKSSVVTLPSFKNVNQETLGCKKVGSVNFDSTVKTGKAVIKSVKSTAKKTAVIKLKKKVSGASEYKIYRSTKKKGTYLCVGTTKNLNFKDKGLVSGKTYYYKVKAVAKNASNADVDSSFSKVKSVRVR